MNKFFLFMAVSISTLSISGVASADGCYLCSGGGYVKYNGDDTFEKRKQAEALGCKVSGTTSSCSSSKGTVGSAKGVTPKLAKSDRNE